MTTPLRQLRQLGAFGGDVVPIASVLGAPPQRFDGLRVGIVGSASAVASVAASLIGLARLVTIFDPYISWVLPPEAALLPRQLRPLAAALHLRQRVGDLRLRDRLSPRGGQRYAEVAFVPDFYELFTEAGCGMVPWPIARATSVGLQIADGMVHRLDVLVIPDGDPNGVR